MGWSAHRQHGKSSRGPARELIQLRSSLAALQRKQQNRKVAEKPGEAAEKPDNAASELRAGLASLHQLTSGVSQDIQTHASQISAGSRELSDLGLEGQGSPAADAVAASMLQANEVLQERLAQAEQKLSEQLEQLQQQSDQARTDALTGLLNRRGFDEEAERCLKEQRENGEPVSFLMLDIDHFKKFNDQHGHDIGDEVLRETARVASLSVRPIDFVARFGGEELVVIMPTADLEEANRVAECVRIAIAENRVKTPQASLEVQVSIGVAAGLQETPDALLKRADTALYAAKNNGRNRTYYHDGQQSLPVLVEAPNSDAQNPADTEELKSQPPEEDVEEFESSENAAPKSEIEGAPTLALKTPHAKTEETEPVALTQTAPRTPISSAPEAPPQEQQPQEPQLQEPQLQKSQPPCRRDALTGLPSSHALVDEAARCISATQGEGGLLSLVLCDVDGMHTIAQEHGERAAELLTIAVAQFLSSVTGNDELLTRSPTGGFAMLMPGRESDDAARIAQRIQHAVSSTALPLGDSDLRLALDTGVAHMTPDDNAKTLLGRAQQAVAKSSHERSPQTDAPAKEGLPGIPEHAAAPPPPQVGFHTSA